MTCSALHTQAMFDGENCRLRTWANSSAGSKLDQGGDAVLREGRKCETARLVSDGSAGEEPISRPRTRVKAFTSSSSRPASSVSLDHDPCCAG